MAEAIITRRGGSGSMTINGQEIIDVVFGETINRGDRVVMLRSIPSLKVEDPSTLPTGHGEGCAFSPDGMYLAVAHSSSPYITIYNRSGDTFTKLSNPSSLPTGDGWGCAFSSDGTYLAVAHWNSPYITIYKRSGDTFTKLSNPSSRPAGNGYDCAFSPDGAYLAVAHYNPPYITIYKGEHQANLYVDSSTYGSGSLLWYAVESGLSNETKKVAKLFKI